MHINESCNTKNQYMQTFNCKSMAKQTAFSHIGKNKKSRIQKRTTSNRTFGEYQRTRSRYQTNERRFLIIF